jgi:hypothetical protein
VTVVGGTRGADVGSSTPQTPAGAMAGVILTVSCPVWGVHAGLKIAIVATLLPGSRAAARRVAARVASFLPPRRSWRRARWLAPAWTRA